MTNAEPRIAFLTNCIPPYHKPVLELLAARYKHFRVFVSTPMEPNRSWNVDWGALDVVVQKTVTLRGRWRHPKGFAEPLYVHFPLDTVKQLRRFGADIVVSNEFGFRTLLAALYTKLRPRARLICWTDMTDASEHGRGLGRQLLRRLLTSNVDAFLALGSGGVRYLRSLGVEGSKIYRFVYTTDFRSLADIRSPERTASPQRLLYVGQLIERKGLKEFINALANWLSERAGYCVEFLLAGDGPLRANLEQVPVPGNLTVKFLGEVAHEDLPRVYAQADVFAFPTLVDVWGVVVNEALAAGLPVLGSAYAQAVTELVMPGRTGWIFRPDDRDDMYRAIGECLQTRPENLQQMRTEACETALRLTPPVVADLIEKAIQSCTNHASAGSAHV